MSDPLPAGTGVSWTMSPAYSGPGSCVITGRRQPGIELFVRGLGERSERERACKQRIVERGDVHEHGGGGGREPAVPEYRGVAVQAETSGFSGLTDRRRSHSARPRSSLSGTVSGSGAGISGERRDGVGDDQRRDANGNDRRERGILAGVPNGDDPGIGDAVRHHLQLRGRRRPSTPLPIPPPRSPSTHWSVPSRCPSRISEPERERSPTTRVRSIAATPAVW